MERASKQREREKEGNPAGRDARLSSACFDLDPTDGIADNFYAECMPFVLQYKII